MNEIFVMQIVGVHRFKTNTKFGSMSVAHNRANKTSTGGAFYKLTLHNVTKPFFCTMKKTKTQHVQHPTVLGRCLDKRFSCKISFDDVILRLSEGRISA